ncbi:rRNA maturation RNase YbeY [Pseudodesulfovibrio tunisiensis]|uniref:rRNA maturation RNase YbeY n=1 Tax=Pseudodesulfovibrio tunisiensis TaxID=463192 RepID=UPI001FB4A967|nr:rRNA maturation RNase YbeY [Pseudodesulfovibrio tunisiensis]
MERAYRVLRETWIDPEFPLSRNELPMVLDAILEMLDLEETAFTLKLVDDREIARLNREFLGCTGPTNILSFPADPDGEEESLGELALSVDTLARETRLYEQEPVVHLARLLAHGLLHLAGYDHGDEMYALTDAAVDRVLLEFAD